MTAAESDILLAECREFLVDRMRTSVTRMMIHMEDALFEKAAVDSSTRPAEVSHYIDAVREIRMKKREIQVRFENRFISLYDRHLRELRAGKPGAGAPDPAWPAYDPADAGTIENAMETARAECRASLSVLDRHVGALLNRPDLENFTNPLQPDTVFDAFLDSCSDIYTGSDIRDILVEMFRRYVVADLHDVYVDLNILFESYKVSARNGIPAAERRQHPTPDENGSTGAGSILICTWIAGNIEDAIDDADTPAFIQDFLIRHWRMVLEKQYRKHGVKSKEWSRAMQVVVDLVACTKSTPDRDQRRQQIWMLPGLVYRLKNGMKSVATPLKTQVDFLGRLKVYHAGLTDSNGSGNTH